jgi:cysteine-rich repeat protein
VRPRRHAGGGRQAALALAVALAAPGAAGAAAPAVPGAVTTTVASTGDPVPVPDADSLISILDVGPVAGRIIDVDVTLDLAHTAPDNLDVFLVSPAGTTVTLSTDNGAGNDNVFAPVTFDDQAPGTPSAPNVRNFTYTDLVPVGVIQPEEALGAVIGETAEGPWALVVVDDAGGQTGTLRGWSLTVTTAGTLHTGAPVALAGAGGSIPDGNQTGRTSAIAVTGLGRRLYDVDVTVDITHPRTDNLDLFLTAPSGRRIDLATDLGGTQANLYAGATFDDQAGAPASDLAAGTPFTRVAGEGALAAFVGEDPNGTWMLTVADDSFGSTGVLNGWTLTLVAAAVCGDGVIEPGETCEDGNTADGDGCDSNCTATACGNGVVSAGEDCDDGNTADGDGCPATCRTAEAACGDCRDDDRNGFIDAADPACAAGALMLARGTLVGGARGRLALAGRLPLGPAPSGPVALVVADAQGAITCATLGTLHARGGRKYTARGRLGGGSVALTLIARGGGRLTLAGRGLDLTGLDDPGLTIGLTVGGERFVTTNAFRARGRRRMYP